MKTFIYNIYINIYYIYKEKMRKFGLFSEHPLLSIINYQLSITASLGRDHETINNN